MPHNAPPNNASPDTPRTITLITAVPITSLPPLKTTTCLPHEHCIRCALLLPLRLLLAVCLYCHCCHCTLPCQAEVCSDSASENAELEVTESVSVLILRISVFRCFYCDRFPSFLALTTFRFELYLIFFFFFSFIQSMKAYSITAYISNSTCTLQTTESFVKHRESAVKTRSLHP